MTIFFLPLGLRGTTSSGVFFCGDGEKAFLDLASVMKEVFGKDE
jgi:hypothetical protein